LENQNLMPSVLKIATTIAGLSLAATSVGAQTPAAPANFALPHAYAGYSQPEITQCAVAGPLRASCTVPAMTAGRYVIVARASATATGAPATQALSISLGGQACASVKSNPFTGAKGVPPLFCQVTFLTDTPLSITADFAVENATPDPAGPRLVIRRAPWSGVVDARGGALAPRPAAPAAAATKK
jgi:hypothetical protein